MKQAGTVTTASEIVFTRFLPLQQNHARDLLSAECLHLSFVLNLNLRSPSLLYDTEGPEFHVRLDDSVIETTVDETIRVEDGV